MPRVTTFGENAGADTHLEKFSCQPDGSSVQARIGGQPITYRIGAPGKHHVKNSLAVLTAVRELGADLALAGLALADMQPPKGRGQVNRLGLPRGEATLIDESYNANPASMRAALSVMKDAPKGQSGRRIAVLGDMLELGAEAPQLHASLLKPLEEAGIDLVFCAGPLMRSLWEKIPKAMRAAHSDDAGALKDLLLTEVRPGDVLVIKGSLGIRMGQLVEALKTEYPPVSDVEVA